MNVALDSPLEAIAFNYLGYGFLTIVNNIWTWIVIITAAFGFWKIRALSPSVVLGSDTIIRVRDDPSPLLQSKVVKRVEEPTAELPAISVLEETKLNEGGTKGKLTLYYNAGDFREAEDGKNNPHRLIMKQISSPASENYNWERIMEVRMEDMGWYEYQDLMVLDGSVVRLWNDFRHGNATAG